MNECMNIVPTRQRYVWLKASLINDCCVSLLTYWLFHKRGLPWSSKKFSGGNAGNAVPQLSSTGERVLPLSLGRPTSVKLLFQLCIGIIVFYTVFPVWPIYLASD